MDPHASSELMVFREFAAACSLGLLPETARKQQPPEPDILCDLESGGALAFEMVTTDDSTSIQKTKNGRKLDEELNARYDEAAAEGRIDRPEMLNGHIVMVDFEEGTTSKNRVKALPRVIELLNDLGPTCRRRNERPVKLALFKPNHCVADQKPYIFSGNACHVGSHTLSRVQSKLTKGAHYRSHHRIHLLAWSSSGIPEELWTEELLDLLESNVDARIFDRVWVYDRGRSSITFDSLA